MERYVRTSQRYARRTTRFLQRRPVLVARPAKLQVLHIFAVTASETLIDLRPTSWDLNAMCDSVLALGAASYLFDKAGVRGEGDKDRFDWFIDEATKMNPNLRFGQAVHGRAEGRPEGLIAIRSLIWLLEGVRLAEESSGWDPQVSAGLKNWLHEFQKWELSSDIGRVKAKRPIIMRAGGPRIMRQSQFTRRPQDTR